MCSAGIPIIAGSHNFCNISVSGATLDLKSEPPMWISIQTETIYGHRLENYSMLDAWSDAESKPFIT